MPRRRRSAGSSRASTRALPPFGPLLPAPEVVAAIRTIGIGYDGGPESKVALAGAIDLARSTNASLRIVAVAHPPTTGYAGGLFTFAGGTQLAEAIAEQMQDELDQALGEVPQGIEAAGSLVTDPQETLGDQEGLDLLVVGSRAWGPLGRVLLGSVSSHLVRSAPCPLLVFPRGAKAPPDVTRATAEAAAA